jgi:hypothetical protein
VVAKTRQKARLPRGRSGRGSLGIPLILKLQSYKNRYIFFAACGREKMKLLLGAVPDLRITLSHFRRRVVEGGEEASLPPTGQSIPGPYANRRGHCASGNGANTNFSASASASESPFESPCKCRCDTPASNRNFACS